MTSSSHTVDRRSFYTLQAFRAVIAASLTAFGVTLVDVGTSTAWLVAVVIIGTFFAGYLLRRGKRFLPVTIWHILAYGLLSLGLWLAEAISLSGGNASGDFAVFRFGEHIWLALFFYSVSFAVTWLFWCWRQAVTLEALCCSALFVWLLAAHQNYQLDAPKNIIKYAWENPFLQLEPQRFLLGLGICFTLLLGLYLVVAHNRPIFGDRQPVRSRGRGRVFVSFVTPTVLLLLFLGFASYVDQLYSQDLSRASNGVGMAENEEGDSPLGFHSALGQTRQPSALVRLEGDYNDNPWAPMLYLREGALSRFNGKELVIASRSFDQDVPDIAPGEPYIRPTEADEARTKVVQSIYLLSKHRALFAIDYPQTVRLIKNPDTDRFNLAYQALSLAPSIRLDSLIGERVGNPEWSKSEWNHYLRAPGSRSQDAAGEWAAQYDDGKPMPDEHGEDLRYRAFARKLTATAHSPVEKAVAISSYLSQTSLYTRKPGHEITEQGDPVAPYLFSDDKRGYCVHFSHAAVYLMRLVGIPARIATGYLTDLSYAKDGHILLHLGDRHAWPEIYVEGVGWTVADITPANAENEEPIVPDESLLEELMSKLDPAEDLVTPPPLEPVDTAQEAVLGKVLTARNLLTLTLTLLAAFLTIKFWLRFGWRITSDPRRRVQLAYAAHASFLSDIGIDRHDGETRREFAKRVESRLGLSAKRLSDVSEETIYANLRNSPSATDVSEALEECRSTYDKRWKRYLSFFSPRSLTRFRRW